MRINKMLWLSGLFGVLVLALVACGGSEATATPPPTATAVPQQASSELSAKEQEYLDKVAAAAQLTVQVFEGFREIFSQTYPVREVLLAALLEGGVGTPYIGNLAALEALDPPERFREVHRVWLEAVREQLRLDTEAAGAVRDGDLVRFALLNGDLVRNDTNVRLALPPVFCQSTLAGSDTGAICTPVVTSSEGEYESGVDGLLREYLPEVTAASGTIAFRLSLTPEELGEVLLSMADGGQIAFQGLASGLETLTPPDELLADHGRLQAYFSGVLTIADAMRQLQDGGDLNAVRFELQKLETLFCETRASIEAAGFKPAVAVFFTGGPERCGGAPF